MFFGSYIFKYVYVLKSQTEKVLKLQKQTVNTLEYNKDAATGQNKFKILSMQQMVISVNSSIPSLMLESKLCNSRD